ncbi:lecithin retinol acyltransferase family protein [Clostridium hydrogenum]|uniref:lecithin retinol acyltransferase family protein n=1 Tax=Clostridium hydrogenum TaxID=2855764 RepID=UPI002E380B24|nr:lecithin retinol acyltransferase family protein [Clostridium hydrogenum]
MDSYPKPKYTPKEIIKRAESKLGSDFGGYNLISNNCEHFKLGKLIDKVDSKKNLLI